MGLSLSAHADEVSDCKLNPKGILPITFSGNELKPSIEGSINDAPTKVVIDTSASLTKLNRTVLQRLGVRAVDTGARVYGTGTERSIIYQAKVRKLQVGPALGRDVFEVADDQETEFGIRIGANFLFQYDTEIFLTNKYVGFFKPVGCKEIALVYWKEVWTVLPFHVADDDNWRPHFTVKINGREVDAMISTSISDSLLDLRAAKRIGITPQSSGVAPGQQIQSGTGEILPTWVAPIETIEIGGEKVSTLKIKMTDLGSASSGIILGLDFLRAHRILVSMSQRNLYLT